MRNESFRSAFRRDLLTRLSEGQRLGLRKHIRQQDVVVATERIEWLRERDEIAGNETGSLMNQLVERMLPVGARLAPVDGTRGVVDVIPFPRDVLPVALHRQLLQVCGEP